MYLCRTHWSDAPTTLIHLVFYFASKALRKKLLFQLYWPSSGSHQINHGTVEITNSRSLIYTKSLKMFSYNLRSRKICANTSIFALSLPPLRATRFVKKINKRICANLKSKPMSAILDRIASHPLLSYASDASVHIQPYFISLVQFWFVQRK